MNLKSLEDGAGLGQSLLKHGAKHHKKSYEMFLNGKLERMEKSSNKKQTGMDQQQDRKVTKFWNEKISKTTALHTTQTCTHANTDANVYTHLNKSTCTRHICTPPLLPCTHVFGQRCQPYLVICYCLRLFSRHD